MSGEQTETKEQEGSHPHQQPSPERNHSAPSPPAAQGSRAQTPPSTAAEDGSSACSGMVQRWMQTPPPSAQTQGTARGPGCSPDTRRVRDVGPFPTQTPLVLPAGAQAPPGTPRAVRAPCRFPSGDPWSPCHALRGQRPRATAQHGPGSPPGLTSALPEDPAGRYAPFRLDRTKDRITASFSRPWKPSTDLISSSGCLCARLCLSRST